MTDEENSDLGTGFDGFLQKPFTMSELYREVEKVLLSFSE